VLGTEGVSMDLIDATSNFGAEVMVGWVPEDWREWVGGVGGRPGAPILLDACFSVRGLEVSELGIEDIPVSMMRSRGFGAGVEG
jgi:hypothetical protein